uniref:CCHC-type domain-containing protein n=1 Tax=Ananas comosus var. bracteatus TaxID=296719 RepID=A0A6V7QCA4_ANACO|nr:unnamed protein product [Ananas comosus var. bracteatus]
MGFAVGETSRGRHGVGCQEKLKSCVRPCAWERVGKKKKILKRIAWADEVGGELLQVFSCQEDDEATLAASGKGALQDQKEAFIAGHQRSKLRVLPGGSQSGVKSKGEGVDIKCPTILRGSYKEALLKRLVSLSCTPKLHHHHPLTAPSQTSRGPPPRGPVKRCFRCLASDHSVAVCRDPIWCRRCWKTGHRAYFCKEKPGSSDNNMHRAANLRGRAPLAKVFVPYTEEYLRRVELCCNAILADVIQPANLGPDPISAIKSALASLFGGYTEDFAVARCRERDYAIFPS